ncbi:MAG: MBG domain-containing protein [Bacteroidales bacterium]|nr:MBG domain-containing protein [Bacteroidales bacterium]
MYYIKTTLLALFVSVATMAQKSITQQVYWIDNDIGAATAIATGTTLDVSAMAPGMHVLTMRVQDSDGLWSSPETRFFVVPHATTEPSEIVKREYWIDNEIAARTDLTDSPMVLSLLDLAPGVHFFTARIKDNAGLWSVPETRIFVVPHATVEATSIVEREYWIDNEIAARTTLEESPTQISLLDIAPGVHILTARVKDDAGLWSVPETRIFIVPHAMVEATQIVEREYWIDNKVATRASLADSPAEIALLGLTPGMHSFTMRVKDDAGIWSVPESRFFITPTQAEQDGLTIAQYMYWIDGDTLNFTSAAVSDPTAALPVTISHLDEGDHTISWRVADSKGTWSEAMTQSFTFTKTSITGDMITLTPATFEYSAEDITPEVTVADGESTLLEGEDYDLAISDNHDVGTATVTVTGKGAYKDTDNATFTITQAPLTVTADDKERHEDDEVSPELTISYSGWKGSDDESVLLTAPTIQCAVTADSPMGTYPITVSGGEARNYYLVYVNGIFTISEPVAVTSLKADTLDPDTKVYDLHGRPVIWRTAPKGIYIFNGRKILK